jgi:hypothetical protein
MTATVGDFLTAATAHLDAAAAADVHRLDDRDNTELADALSAAIRAGERLAMGPPPLWGIGEASAYPARARTTQAVRTAYARATAALPHTLDQPAPRCAAAAHVLAAATNLGVATDLLATHSVSIPGALVPLSDTAAVLDTPAARWSLVVTAATYAAALADLTRRSVFAQMGTDPPRGRALLAAHGQLTDAAAAIPQTLRRAVSGIGLASIRPLPFPRNEPPRPAAPPAENLHRAASLANQLRTRAYRDGSFGATPTAHSPGVLMASAAAAVTAHRAVGLILYTLSVSPDTDVALSLSSLTREAIRAAADQTTRSGEHWKAVHHAWSGVRTALEIPPTAAVMQDVINLANCARAAAYRETGRVGTRPRQTARTAEELFTDQSGLRDIASALHQLLAEFPGLAREHARLAEQMSRRGQLLVRTSTLDESPPGPARRYCRAPRPTEAALFTAYADARECGTSTSDDLTNRLCGLVSASARAEPMVSRNQPQPARSRS